MVSTNPVARAISRLATYSNRGHRGSVLRRSGITFLSVLVLLGPVLPVGRIQSACAQQGVAKKLRAALAAVPHSETRVSAYVVDLRTGKPLFARNADTPLIPASSIKIFVMAAAITELGAGFHFETVLALQGADLVLIGDGDPALGDQKLHRRRGEEITADFERWADALVERGVDAIPGDLLIDESIFDDQWLHPTWEESDLDNWYAAPVGALNFNDNCIDITVAPAQKRGAPVLVSVQPEGSLVRIINECRSGGKGKPILRHRYDAFEYRITGRCGKRWPFGSVSFPDPGLLTADSLVTVLARKGIRLEGAIRRERVRRADGFLPDSLVVIGSRRTPLADVLNRVGKDSQNFFAECLLKRIGYASARRRGETDPKGSWPVGSQAIVQSAHRAGIDTNGLAIADGSGLSRHNRCTARQMATLLAWIQTQPRGDLFYDSLSIAGVDGSLRKRLSDIPGRVFAKTGTMRGIRTLAGYVNDTREPHYAFAVLFNGYTGPSTPYKDIQDRFCRILASSLKRPSGG